ncbi:unnamed protein product, partial [Hymenolepis diminuta]
DLPPFECVFSTNSICNLWLCSYNGHQNVKKEGKNNQTRSFLKLKEMKIIVFE